MASRKRVPDPVPNPEDSEFYESLGPRRRAGKPPSRPKGLAKRLQQLIKESNQWARRCEEVWFDVERLLEQAHGPNSKKTLELYQEAIDAFREVAKWAAQGKKNLANGRKIMEERLQLEISQDTGNRQKRT